MKLTLSVAQPSFTCDEHSNSIIKIAMFALILDIYRTWHLFSYFLSCFFIYLYHSISLSITEKNIPKRKIYWKQDGLLWLIILDESCQVSFLLCDWQSITIRTNYHRKAAHLVFAMKQEGAYVLMQVLTLTELTCFC